MARTILIAGATGALGRQLTRHFHDSGWRVRGLTRDAKKLSVGRDGVDEVVIANALAGDSLEEATRGVQAVFSCLGAPVLPKLSLGYKAFSKVDVPANTNLIEAAKKNGVTKFGYVSTHHKPEMANLDYVRAHEEVVRVLKDSGLTYCVVRPTGFFSALGEFVHMARAGAVPEFGDGNARTNPIDDGDLAQVCVDALEKNLGEISAGGPDILSRREIAELAFHVVGKPAKVRTLPVGLAKFASVMGRPFNPRITHFIAFIAAISTTDVIADKRGTKKLDAYFRALTSR